MIATTVELRLAEVCRLKEKGDRSCMTTLLTAEVPQGYNKSMTSNTKLSKDRGLVLECKPLQICLGSKLLDRDLTINSNQRISTSCRMPLKGKLKSFLARISMFRKESILQASLEIIITWWWGILKQAQIMDQDQVGAKVKLRTLSNKRNTA